VNAAAGITALAFRSLADEQFDAAVSLFHGALALGPAEATSLLGLALACARAGRDDEAGHALDAAAVAIRANATNALQAAFDDVAKWCRGGALHGATMNALQDAAMLRVPGRAVPRR
jgi:hypothetical protein